jgi:hypothetical protein
MAGRATGFRGKILHRSLAVVISSLIVWTSAAASPAAGAAAGCAAMLPTTYTLTDLPPTSPPAGLSSNGYLYYVGEGEGPGTFSIDEFDDGCRMQPSVRYDVVDGNATPTVDFTPITGRVSSDAPGLSVPIADDAVEEPLEHAMVRLSDARDAVVGVPSQAPLYILDDDGPSRVQFEQSSYSQREYLSKMSIHLFRQGSATGPASVHFTVTSADATPGVDHSAPAGGTVTFASGQRAAAIQFDVKNDSVRENAETLTFTLDNPSSTSLGAVTTATLTIQDDDGDHVAPVSRFHHPRRGWTYGNKDYRLSEFHVFAEDSGGSAVKTAQVALRRKKKNGSCSWLNGRGWTAGGCGDHLWKRPSGKYPPIRGETFFYYRLKTLLKPSVGDSRIRHYTAFSRAVDRVGNRESAFQAGRNSNTFDVRRGKRTTKT